MTCYDNKLFQGDFSLNSSIFREEVRKFLSESFSTELQLKQPTPKPLKIIKLPFQEEAGKKSITCSPITSNKGDAFMC